MTAVIKFAGLAVLLIACAAIAREKKWEARRRLIVLLTVYISVAHLVVGFRQIEAWPFAPYRLLHGIAQLDAENWRISFYGVDRSGREWRIDPYAWKSIPDWHLQWWFMRRWENLSEPAKLDALQFLFTRAEANRQEIRQHGGLPRHSILGPLAAPQWWMFPREPAAPAEPYRQFRVYKEVWTGEGRIKDLSSGRRTLLGEWRQP